MKFDRCSSYPMHVPIILFCYKRLDTLNRCINSLLKCREAKDSDLIIYSDAGASEIDRVRVEQVRGFLRSIAGFKSIKIIVREKNLGVDYNVIEGLKEIVKSYDMFIVVEDDLVFSELFLNYMNQALIFYRNHETILSVSAFSYLRPPKKYKWDVYFTGRTNSWGWGSWSDRIKNVDWEIEDKKLFLKNKRIQKKFNFWGSDRSNLLKKTLLRKLRAWDIRIDYHAFKFGFYTVYPTKNLVQNIGFTKEATNTTGYNRFNVKIETITLSHFFNFPEFITLNNSINAKFILRNSIINRILSKLFTILNLHRL